MELFVPGRICLFGEYSDLAGGYRRLNAGLEIGYTLITGTNQGIHAEVKPHPSKLLLRSTLNNGEKKTFESAINPDLLLKEAQSGGFFSYAAGVAYQIASHYRVRGIEIDNDWTDLPIQKGLSSSAAICVLVARAFNRIYDLKMTVRGEMEYAYLGEITTPSRCGRMDQGCAYSSRPIMMTFDGERIDIKEITIQTDLYFILVDLHAYKDTKKQIARVNTAFPFAENKLHEKIQHYLGPVNRRIVTDAAAALARGDARMIGELMSEAQAGFDRYVRPACPDELAAPVLHRLLEYKPLQKHIYGGKLVGSGGDGSAQLVARDEKNQRAAMALIERQFGMGCLPLVLRAGKKIAKAVIPAAGFGTRMFPASKAVKKELFPVIDTDGRAKPAIMTVVEEAVESGIENICIVVQPDESTLFSEFFHLPPKIENYNKLSASDRRHSDYVLSLGEKVSLVFQNVQEGFGHAVYCARDWVGDEPFLLLLGDHLYRTNCDKRCALQLLEVYENVGHSVVGLLETNLRDLHRYGCVTGVWVEKGRLLSATEVYEKPDPAYAREHLHVDGMPDDCYLALFGLYILTPAIFECIGEHIRHNIRETGEFQLSSCLDMVRRREGLTGYVVEGSRFDIGMPEGYLDTLPSFRQGGGKKNS
jgi:UTP-glucose-1-phosphate uridylyltransferase/mevalonate kinase